MKAPLLLTLIAAVVFPLAACESTSATRTADASDTHDVYVGGNGSQRNLTVPNDQAQNADHPFALRGNNQPSDSNAANRTSQQGTNGW
jgi:hypothetical protein